jgi:hypothetical protein
MSKNRMKNALRKNVKDELIGDPNQDWELEQAKPTAPKHETTKVETATTVEEQATPESATQTEEAPAQPSPTLTEQETATATEPVANTQPIVETKPNKEAGSQEMNLEEVSKLFNIPLPLLKVMQQTKEQAAQEKPKKFHDVHVQENTYMWKEYRKMIELWREEKGLPKADIYKTAITMYFRSIFDEPGFQAFLTNLQKKAKKDQELAETIQGFLYRLNQED